MAAEVRRAPVDYNMRPDGTVDSANFPGAVRVTHWGITTAIVEYPNNEVGVVNLCNLGHQPEVKLDDQVEVKPRSAFFPPLDGHVLPQAVGGIAMIVPPLPKGSRDNDGADSDDVYDLGINLMWYTGHHVTSVAEESGLLTLPDFTDGVIHVYSDVAVAVTSAGLCMAISPAGLFSCSAEVFKCHCKHVKHAEIEIMAASLVFVMCKKCAVSLVLDDMDWLIPDVPLLVLHEAPPKYNEREAKVSTILKALPHGGGVVTLNTTAHEYTIEKDGRKVFGIPSGGPCEVVFLADMSTSYAFVWWETDTGVSLKCLAV